MYNVNIIDEISQEAYECFPECNYNLIPKEGSDMHAVLVFDSHIDKQSLTENLAAIAKAGTDLANIPIEECSQKGIAVFTSPGASANSVKELVLASMIMTSRHMQQAASLVKEQTYTCLPGNFAVSELAGKNLGVIGLGSRGTLVANAGCMLGMNVYGYDPYMATESAMSLHENVIKAVSMNNLLKNCDYISLHIPLNDKNKNIINKDAFKIMKPGCVLLNFAAAGLVNHKSLITAIEAGTIKKYITDFINKEDIHHPNILTFPNLATSTPEYKNKAAIMAAKQLHSFLQYGNIKNSINLPSCALPYNGSYRLTFVHSNEISMVSQITKVLAAYHINIEDMLTKSSKTISYTIIDTYAKPQDFVLEKLKSINKVLKVRLISHT